MGENRVRENTCGNCEFFQPDPDYVANTVHWGECHIRSVDTSIWPPRKLNGWCGEHPNIKNPMLTVDPDGTVRRLDGLPQKGGM